MEEKFIQQMIDYYKKRFGRVLTRDEALEKLEEVENRGCLVEYSFDCPSCPKFCQDCLIY